MPCGRPRHLAGERFGTLTVVRRASKGEAKRGKGKRAQWLVRCDCGAERFAKADLLVAGKIKACGVAGHSWALERSKLNGGPQTSKPEYGSWKKMHERCSNPRQHNYHLYGGRGIAVCERWRKFEAFLADMGSKPTPAHTIDRIDGDKGYGPENCRWATAHEQRRNQRRSVYVDAPVGRKLLVDYATEVGVAYGVLYERLRRGWTLERASSTPIARHGVASGAR